jgi:HAD superfamily hydrolase (TIGR01509 family)
MTPKVVVFDLGKVLVDFDYSIAGRRIAARTSVSAQRVRDFIDHSPLLVQLETGQLTDQQFYAEVRSATGFSGSYEEFAGYFADIFVPIEPMVGLHAALRRRSVPTYVFSNTNDLAVTHIRHSFPFFSEFDGYVFSYKHGAMKPDPALYEVVERVCGRRGSEILYLDDREENVAAGAARGWQVILQQEPAETIAEIRRLGLLNDE